MGCHQLSEMTMFDYINGITIGSIAAEMAVSLEDDFRIPLFAMGIYAAFSLLLTFMSKKSIILRRIINGKSVILMSNGNIYRENLKKAKLEIHEFLIQCRNNGFFDLTQIETVILEPNGKLSILPKSENRPLTPKDMNLTVPEDSLAANIIIDGKILKQNLRHIGKDEAWLERQLHEFGVSDVKNIYLATCDKEDQLTFYIKICQKNNIDVLD